MSAGQANYVTHIDKPHYSVSGEGFIIVEGVTSAVRHNHHSQNNETTCLYTYYIASASCSPCTLLIFANHAT